MKSILLIIFHLTLSTPSFAAESCTGDIVGSHGERGPRWSESKHLHKIIDVAQDLGLIKAEYASSKESHSWKITFINKKAARLLGYSIRDSAYIHNYVLYGCFDENDGK